MDTPYLGIWTNRKRQKCGFAEESWYCGNQILREVHSKLDRSEAYKFVEGGVHNNGKFVRVGNIRDKEKLYKMAVTGNG